MSIDSIIDIDISLSAPAVSRAGFGTPLIGCHNLPVGFTERIRFYASASDAASDADLTADAKARLTTGFGQSPAPNQIAVGRLDNDQAQIVEFTVTVALVVGDWTITINGITETYTSLVTDTVTLVAAALAGLINANPTLSAIVTATPALGVCSVEADVAGTAFTYSSTAPVGGTMTEVETQANLSVATSLDEIMAENAAGWYGLCLDTRLTFLANNDLEIERTAAWTEANRKLFFAQSASADIITSVSTDVASDLKAATYQRTALIYYSDNAENTDIAWLATFLANDFDQTAPTAAYQTLEGIPTQNLGTTAQNNLNGKYANYYTTLKGVGATANGLVAANYDIELIVTADWVEARASESVAQLFLDTANSGTRIYYNELGFQQVAGLVFAVLKNGETIGHFNQETSQVVTPKLSAVSASDRSAGILRMEFGTQYSGKVRQVIIRGTVSADFTSLT